MGGAVSSGRDNNELVDNLVSAAYIRTRSVERVFRALDRADYMTPTERDQAYKDLAWRSGALHLSAPCIYSEVLEALDLRPGLSFLNVGSGTGYFSALVGLIIGSGGISHGVEIHPGVVEYATKKLSQLQENSVTLDEFDFCMPKYYCGNGLCLAPLRTQYDRVYVGASVMPKYEKYFKQLIKVNGVLVMPLGENLVRIQRVSETEWTSLQLLNVSFALLRIPTLEEAVNPLKMDELVPVSLMLLCRATIRRAMLAGVCRRHPELREPPPRRPLGPRQRPRTICIPLDRDTDDARLNQMHDLQRHEGGRELNALLSLVLSMGNNRGAGSLRFEGSRGAQQHPAFEVVIDEYAQGSDSSSSESEWIPQVRPSIAGAVNSNHDVSVSAESVARACPTSESVGTRSDGRGVARARGLPEPGAVASGSDFYVLNCAGRVEVEYEVPAQIDYKVEVQRPSLARTVPSAGDCSSDDCKPSSSGRSPAAALASRDEPDTRAGTSGTSATSSSSGSSGSSATRGSGSGSGGSGGSGSSGGSGGSGGSGLKRGGSSGGGGGDGARVRRLAPLPLASSRYGAPATLSTNRFPKEVQIYLGSTGTYASSDVVQQEAEAAAAGSEDIAMDASSSSDSDSQATSTGNKRQKLNSGEGEGAASGSGSATLAPTETSTDNQDSGAVGGRGSRWRVAHSDAGEEVRVRTRRRSSRDARRVRLSIMMKRAVKELPLPYALKKYVNLHRCFEF